MDPAKVMTAAFGLGPGFVRTWVLPPTTAMPAEGFRDIDVPSTVICPPGVNVWPAITNREFALAVYVEPANFINAGFGLEAGVART